MATTSSPIFSPAFSAELALRTFWSNTPPFEPATPDAPKSTGRFFKGLSTDAVIAANFFDAAHWCQATTGRTPSDFGDMLSQRRRAHRRSTAPRRHLAASLEISETPETSPAHHYPTDNGWAFWR